MSCFALCAVFESLRLFRSVLSAYAENMLQMIRICTRVPSLIPRYTHKENVGPYKLMDVRIYYEDTDAGGVVYHANYIKYLERARTEYFRVHGFLVAELARNGFVFPVIRLEMDFKAPVVHDDLLFVSTDPIRVGGSSVTLCQKIVRKHDAKLLAEGMVTLACISPNLKARRIPLEIRKMLETEQGKKYEIV